MLGSCLKVLHQEAGIGTEGVSNKTGRTTCISQMGAEGVPPKVGMKIFGHKSESAYDRYNQRSAAQVQAAVRCATNSTPYASTVSLETPKGKQNLIDGGVRSEANVCVKKLKTTPLEGIFVLLSVVLYYVCFLWIFSLFRFVCRF